MACPIKPKILCVCKFCSKEFYTRPSEVKTFCSRNCAQQYKGIDKTWLEKRNKTNLEKYGFEASFKSPQVQQKFKENLLKKFGYDNPFKVPEVKKKSQEIILEKYGCEYASQNKDVAAKLSKSLKGKSKTKKDYLDNKWDQLIKYHNETRMKPLFDKEDLLLYKVSNYNNKWKFKCDNCGKIDEYALINNYMPLCSCNKKSISSIENSFKEFILSIVPENEVYFNKRSILENGQELDVYIPKYNLAIELNGIFWHSDTCGKDRKYHLNKTEICLQKGIHLIHIMDKEWKEKPSIIKSIILNKMNMVPGKIYARKCLLKNITDKEEIKNFLNDNHIQGNVSSPINLGLYHNGKLVSLMTFGKNRFKKQSNEWEMVRFCNKLNTTVIGGASKLFIHFNTNYNPDNQNIVSFADRRFFSGKLYKTLGFDFDSFTSPSYIYWKNSHVLSRMACQKHKLEKLLDDFDPNLSEYNNMLNNGWRRIWDCGNYKWVFKNNSKKN